MADEVDVASELEALERDARISQARAAASKLVAGTCNWCGEGLRNDLHFCPDDDCRDMYDYHQRIARNQGRKFP
jgi:hypothetical protein